MRWLIVTDIHANLTALEAVLQTPEARGCDRVLSLGDQVNYGPQPAQVIERLRGLGAVMLRGNHEDRFDRVESPDFAAYNWALLRWTWQQVKDILPDMPQEIRLGSVLCTHAVPGDLNKLIFEPDVPAVLDALPLNVTHLITGHNHAHWRVEHGGRVGVNPGSLGMMEQSGGALAPFAVLDMRGSRPVITCHAVPYDVAPVMRAYLDSGCCRIAPELTHMAAATMLHGGAPLSLLMVARVKEVAAQTGLAFGDRETWQRADLTLDWPDGLCSEAFWRKMEKQA